MTRTPLTLSTEPKYPSWVKLSNFTTSLHLEVGSVMMPRALHPRRTTAPGTPSFEARTERPSCTLPHNATDSLVLRPNRSNCRCRCVSDLPPCLDAFNSFTLPPHRATYSICHLLPARLGRCCLHHHVFLLFHASYGPPMTLP